MHGLSTLKLSVARAIPLALISLVALLVVGVPFSGAEDLRILNDKVGEQVEVKKGDDLRYEVKDLQIGDYWLIQLEKQKVAEGRVESSGDLANYNTETQTGDLTGTFPIPDLGDKSMEVEVLAAVSSNPEEPDAIDREKACYVSGGSCLASTGPTGGGGTTSPIEHSTPAPVATVTSQAPKTTTTPAAKKKATTRNNSNSNTKRNSTQKNSGSGGSGGGGTNTTPAPISLAPESSVPIAAAPITEDLPSIASSGVAAAPAGISGPTSSSGTPLPGTPPAGDPATAQPVPATAAPLSQVANIDDGFNAPMGLVLLLGLIMLVGLVGAESRLLGFWGPPPKISRDAQDARLVALGRVARSGAALQNKIAEYKKSAKEPIG